jgi:glycosyltransferase involved in cell wall biosynthesis
MDKTIHIISYLENNDANNHNWYVSTSTTIEAFKELKYKVILHESNGNKHDYLRQLLNIYLKLQPKDVVYIIIDGKAALDKFSVLKLLKPSIVLVWEIHAVESEYLWFHHGIKAELHVLYKRLIRFIWARGVDRSFSLSKTLQSYSKYNLKISNSFLIKSVVNKKITTELSLNNSNSFTSYDLLCQNDYYIVFWSGGGFLPWQSLDLIEKTAKKIYSKDKKIVFVIVASKRWHNFKFQKNIVFYDNVDFMDNLKMASKSDVCLAPYSNISKKITGFSFYYSPRKVVEFMALEKPVIVSKNLVTTKMLLNGKCGILCNNNPETISKKILFLKNNNKFATLLGQNAKEHVMKNYTIDNLKKIYLARLNDGNQTSNQS